MRLEKYKKFIYCIILVIIIMGMRSFESCGKNLNASEGGIIGYVGAVRRLDIHASTIKHFLRVALQPVGSVMYIYGGGWNEADDGAGVEAVTIGLSDAWMAFADLQDSSYYHKSYNYKEDVSVIHLGLDCSGYVGWVLYNTFQDGNGYVGWVDYANVMGDNLANMGYGHMTESYEITDYKPGDIMSSSGHIWICIGQCQDGSVVLLHSSPPGVQLAGTVTGTGSINSEAIRLANMYMKEYYPEWYSRYPDGSRPGSYLTEYRQFRFDIGSESIMTDPDGYYNMTVEEILEDLFSEF